ncbi:TonB-dependent receptor [Kushneria marisflavi]|uniref:TonB-dependent siderophore receptor n=1 Tax=Kushneria marisflavi TaxID=157779 RepID=A0A240UQR7_9GAMM|nr:TonB-dependent siderophore receptor [Kushneria marisflavi]ART63370.1 TonB-dependent siderophore receptor [Kushneria marisflavi]RKD84417.1 iron complex outermembrane receptor protein [Kushneria marisflavi]
MTREQDFGWWSVQRFAAGIAIGSAVAAGAATAAEQEGNLETITVTSTAIETAGNLPPPAYAGGQVAQGGRLGILGEQDAMNSPFNVISYTDELIENQQAETIGDVLQNDASVAVGTGFGNYAESFKIRGFNLYNDDMSFGGLYGVLPRQIVASDFASRVELFKGASAFANGVPAGGTGVGGSVNIEPKRATDTPINRLSTGYTSDGYIDSGVDIGRRFGEANEFGARLVLKRGRGDTAVNDAERENTLALLGLDYDGGDNRLSFDLGHQKTVIDGDRLNLNLGSYTGNSVPDVPDADANYVPGWNRSSLETTFAMVRGEHDFNDDWTGYAALGGNRTHERTLSGSVSLADEEGNGTVSQLDTAYQSESLASQTGLRGKLDTGPVSHQLNLGYSSVYSRKDVAYEGNFAGTATNLYDPADIALLDSPFVSGNLSDPNTTGRVYNNGVSLSDTLGFIDDRLLLTLGARYQEIEVNNYSGDGSSQPGFSESRVTPVYGLLYKATDNISLYANHIEALQQGDTAPTSIGNDPVTNAGQILGIVRSKQDEVGAKFDYGNLGGGIALFQIEQPQVSIETSADGTRTAGYNGEQRNRGLETSLYGEPLEGVRLLASATWMDPELRDTTDSANDGNDAPGVAGYRYVLGGEWDLPDVQNLTATGRVIRNGSQYVDEANHLKVDPWTRLDLGLRYTMPFNEGSLIWRADVENVTDEAYWASAATTGSQTLLQGEPRTFKLSATLDF